MIKLTAETVINFVGLRARMKKMVEREKQDSAAIKEAMQAVEIKEFGPPASPYMLTMRTVRQTSVDYEDMAMKAYRKLYGKEWKEQFEEDKDAYGTKKVTSLHPEPNPRYKPA